MREQPTNARDKRRRDRAVREAVETFAESVLVRNGVTRPPVDVDAIAAREGVEFKVVPFTGIVGAYVGVIRDDLPAVAFIGGTISAARRRFTKAHELGHDLIDGRVTWVRTPRSAAHVIEARREVRVQEILPRRYSKNADFHLVHECFAASLLMPRSMVNDLVRSLPLLTPRRVLIAAVMRTFRVSTAAAMLRLDELLPDDRDSGGIAIRTSAACQSSPAAAFSWSGYRSRVARADVAGMYRLVGYRA